MFCHRFTGYISYSANAKKCMMKIATFVFMTEFVFTLFEGEARVYTRSAERAQDAEATRVYTEYMG